MHNATVLIHLFAQDVSKQALRTLQSWPFGSHDPGLDVSVLTVFLDVQSHRPLDFHRELLNTFAAKSAAFGHFLQAPAAKLAAGLLQKYAHVGLLYKHGPSTGISKCTSHQKALLNSQT